MSGYSNLDAVEEYVILSNLEISIASTISKPESLILASTCWNSAFLLFGPALASCLQTGNAVSLYSGTYQAPRKMST